MSDWFSTWFDTKYYPLLYSERDFSEGRYFLSNLFTLPELKNRKTVLDLACGSGRYSRIMSEQGLRVVGTDISENQIVRAKQADPEKKVQFLVHDMRNQLYINYFDAVFNIFTSFGYFENISDDIIILRRIKETLKSNGVFVFDYFNAHQIKEKEYPITETITKKEVDFRIKKYISEGVIIKNIQVNDNGKSYDFFEKVRLYTKDTFFKMFDEVGFEVIHTFGDYALNSFDEKKSERFIAIATPTK